MSAIGPKQTWARAPHMSAFGGPGWVCAKVRTRERAPWARKIGANAPVSPIGPSYFNPWRACARRLTADDRRAVECNNHKW